MDALSARRRILLNTPHIETSAGELLTFQTDMKAPLKSCRVNFLPVQEGEGDPSPDNVRNITGWNGVEVTHTNKNLIRADDPNNPNANYYNRSAQRPVVYYEDEQGYALKIGTSGSIAEANHAGINATENAQARLFVAPKAGTYTFTCDYKNVGTTYGLRFYKIIDGVTTRVVDIHGGADETWHTRSVTVELGKGDSLCIYFYSDIYWRNLSVIEGDGTDYIENVTNDYAVDWSDEVGTVYGGYVDLVKGELVATHTVNMINPSNTIIFTGDSETFSYAYPYGRYMRTQFSDGATGSWKSEDYCSNALSLKTYNQISHGETGYIKPSTSAVLYWKTPLCTTEEGAESLRESDIRFYYPLRTPITYQLTPQQLLTLKGTNNIWSSANGTLEAKYWTH